MGKPYHLLTEAQKVLARAAKKRWRKKIRRDSALSPLLGSEKIEFESISNIATDTLETQSCTERS